MDYDRSKASKSLMRRTREEKDRRDFVSIIKDGVPEFNSGEGKHKIDVIPYVTGQNHPELPAGEWAYILVVYIHRGIGVNDDTYLCMAKTYNKPCPICEARKRIQDGDSELIKAMHIKEEDIADVVKSLRATQRGIYNVVVYDTDEERRKGVQVWNSSYWLFERIIKSINTDESGEVISVSDPDNGKRIMFERKGSGETTQYIGHKLVDRTYKISDDIIKSAYHLDEVIVMPNYDELNRIFKMGTEVREEESEDEGDPQDRPQRERDPEDVKNRFEVDQPGDVDESPGLTTEKIVAMSRAQLKALIAEQLLDIDPEDEKYDVKADLVAAVLEQLNATGGEAEETQKVVCPEGGTLGKDFDKFRGCDDCGNRKPCRAAKK